MKIIKRGIFKNFGFLVVMQEMGHFCGYVKIPKEHKFYGKDYSDKVSYEEAQKLDIESREYSNRTPIIALFCAGDIKKNGVSLDLLFDVHGGLTYSQFDRKFLSGEPTEDWWIGFDCAHSGDSPSVQNADYVEEECKKLIEQLIILE